jgi:hypothetical protein
LRGRFQSAQKPSANGRPVRRMNSASRGLRPTVGLCRPGEGSLRRRRPTPGAGRLEGPISIGQKPSADGRPAPTEKRSLRRRRPTPGAERLEGPISIGIKAFGQRSACAPNEFGLKRPSADGRPVPTEKRSLRRRRPTPGAGRLERPISIGTKAFGQRSACAPNEFGLEGPSADGRPVPTEKRSLRRRRPTPGAGRLERPISIGTKAFGQRSACAPNEFGLEGPSADGRPAPTGRGFFASAEADAWRVSVLRGRFQSAQKPSADAGRGARRRNSPLVGRIRVLVSLFVDSPPRPVRPR